MSELFGVSLDGLVRDKAPEDPAGAGEEAGAAPLPQSPGSTQRMIGFLLLAVGLFAAVLGLVFEPALILLAVYPIVCGVLCLTVKRYAGLFIGWGSWILVVWYLPHFTRMNLFSIFNPFVHEKGFWVDILISGGLWVLLIWLTIATIRKTRLGRHPLLLVGWELFFLNWRRLPVAFGLVGACNRTAVFLAWATVLLGIALAVLTVRAVWNWRKLRRTGP